MDGGGWMLAAGCWLLDAGRWMTDAPCYAGCWMLDVPCSLLDAGLLDAGCWNCSAHAGRACPPARGLVLAHLRRQERPGRRATATDGRAFRTNDTDGGFLPGCKCTHDASAGSHCPRCHRRSLLSVCPQPLAPRPLRPAPRRRPRRLYASASAALLLLRPLCLHRLLLAASASASLPFPRMGSRQPASAATPAICILSSCCRVAQRSCPKQAVGGLPAAVS